MLARILLHAVDSITETLNPKPSQWEGKKPSQAKLTRKHLT